MRKLKSIILTLLMQAVALTVSAQITSVHGTVQDDVEPLIGATVCEIDGNGRIIESAITDLDGNFTMKVQNPKNKIRFTYVGMKTVILPIDRTTYNIKMESATSLQEVTVVSKRRARGNSLPIPERELSYATQSLDMKQFEGMGATSIDELLQGQVSGLDLVANSGNLGAGSSMKIRGNTSMSSFTNANPLVVVDGNVREVSLDNFDVSSASNEQFADLLNINVEDIANIKFLKDAAAASMYGTEGGNGVIEIITKRGVPGPPRISYKLSLTGTYLPEGYKMLNGDDYTMLLKEAYFNPEQNDNASASVREINYDPTFSEYEQYNNNTDWRDAVTQWGLRQNHYVTISGGGEKARFYIGGGFDHETGTIIQQKLNRFSTRVGLDYRVSDRINVQTNFSLTYTKNHMNSDDLLSIALRKMPNMSIYEQDPFTGEDTKVYYTMLESASDVFNGNQKSYVNPVASAYLAKNERRTYDMRPELVINYDFLSTNFDQTRLTWTGSVYMNVNSNYEDSFIPQELRSVTYNNTSTPVNVSSSGSSKNVGFVTKQKLMFMPVFHNKNFEFMTSVNMELRSSSYNSQSARTRSSASGGISSPAAGGILTSQSSGYSESRFLRYVWLNHFKYRIFVLDFNVTMDGTSKFGPGKRWGYFPSLSGKILLSDIPWVKQHTEKWLSEFAIRQSWAMSGNPPRQDYLFTSKYNSTSQYLDVAAMYPSNIRLTGMKWETIKSLDFGVDMELFNHKLIFALDAYSYSTSDMLLAGYRIPSNSGFRELAYHNSGKMRNTGWEFRINTNQLIKKGDFSLDFNVNFGNNSNKLLEMDDYVLDTYNSVFGYANDETLQRVQLDSPLGAIYGFRYKGVYQYNFNTFNKMSREEQEAFIASGKTAPVAFNENGEIVRDGQGNPVRMMYNYTNDGTGKNYRFNGGDAIYEDVNHDGQINALDIVYLGSSLPKLNGGIGFTVRYAAWRITTMFTYRYGNKIINRARLRAEAMIGNDNQSQAVNYRWRKEGDVTTIPRAMYGNTSNYNSLISDRFVEDGSYFRMGYIQVGYNLKTKWLKSIGINRLSFYGSANNPFVITKYSGVDPDISQGGYAPAIDYSQTPRNRSYTGSITVEF